MELEAESKAHRTWTPVLQVPEETLAVATFQWRRVPLTRPLILKLIAIAAAVVIGCAALAYGVSAIGPKTFGARSEIVYPLNAEIASGSSLRQDRVLSTQLVAIKSRTVLAPVAAKYHLSVDELSKQVVVGVLQDSEVLRIEVDDRNQARALELVSAIATAYLKNAAPDGDTQTQAYLKSQIDQVDAQRSRLTAQISGLQAQGASNSAQAIQLQADLQDLNNQRSALQTQLSDAAVRQLTDPHIQQLTQPYTIGKVAPKPLRAGLAGALAGLMIAVGVVVLMLRRRLRQTPVDQYG